MDLESEARHLVAVPLGSGALMGAASSPAQQPLRSASGLQPAQPPVRDTPGTWWHTPGVTTRGPLLCPTWCWLSQAVVSSQCHCHCLWRAPQLLNRSFPSPHLAPLPVMFLPPCWAWNRRVTVLLRRTAHCPLTMERLQDFLTILQSKIESYLHSLS